VDGFHCVKMVLSSVMLGRRRAKVESRNVLCQEGTEMCQADTDTFALATLKFRDEGLFSIQRSRYKQTKGRTYDWHSNKLIKIVSLVLNLSNFALHNLYHRL
jgi:hypothetical protein